MRLRRRRPHVGSATHHLLASRSTRRGTRATPIAAERCRHDAGSDADGTDHALEAFSDAVFGVRADAARRVARRARSYDDSGSWTSTALSIYCRLPLRARQLRLAARSRTHRRSSVRSRRSPWSVSGCTSTPLKLRSTRSDPATLHHGAVARARSTLTTADASRSRRLARDADVRAALRVGDYARRRLETGLDDLDVERRSIGHQLVSAAVDVVALAARCGDAADASHPSRRCRLGQDTATRHWCRQARRRGRRSRRSRSGLMPRNAEVIRQWSILRDLEASRRLTIDDLAERTGVTTRTIRRDLEALQTSGFPAVRRTDRRQALLDARGEGVPAARRHRLHARGAERAVFQPHAGRGARRDAVPAGRRVGVRQAGGRADARHAPVPRPPAARHPGQGRVAARRRPEAARPSASTSRSCSTRRSTTGARR